MLMATSGKIRRVYRWKDKWLEERAANGELLKTWCSRMVKEPDAARCKYCKEKILFMNRGLNSLKRHASRKSHEEKSRLFHLKLLKTLTNGKTGSSKKSSNPKLSSTTTAKSSKVLSSITTSTKHTTNSTNTTTKSYTTSVNKDNVNADCGKKSASSNLSKKSTSSSRDEKSASRKLTKKLVSSSFIKKSASNNLSKKSAPNGLGKKSASSSLSKKSTSNSLGKKSSSNSRSKKSASSSLSKKSASGNSKQRNKNIQKKKISVLPFPSKSKVKEDAVSSPLTIHSKFSIPLLSRGFLQFNENNSINNNNYNINDIRKATSSSSSSSLFSKTSPQDWTSSLQIKKPTRPIPSISPKTSPLSKTSTNTKTKSKSSPIFDLRKLLSLTSLGNRMSPYVPLITKSSPSFQHQVKSSPQLQVKGVDAPCRLLPIPAVSLSKGLPPKSHTGSQQIYKGANLRGLGPGLVPKVHIERCTPFIPVFLCYFCHEDFPSKSSLYEHHRQCTMKISAAANNTNASRNITANAPMKPNRMLIDASWDTYNQLSTPKKPQRTSLACSIDKPSVSKSGFLNNLGLLPIKTALQQQKRISRKRRNTECESLDWERDDFSPKTPCTPPTPKLLISHLSREEHRSEVGPFRQVFRLPSFDVMKKDANKEGDGKETTDQPTKSCEGKVTERTNGDSEKKDGKYEGKISVARSLYNLDVTSPLGQFVVKHYRADPSLHILSDIESHCQTAVSTSTKSTTCSLRTRAQPYHVTFYDNSRRALFEEYSHSYKFNKTEVKEFMRRVNTGLDKTSRRLLRQMKKCRVILRHISKADIRHWISSLNSITVDVKPLSSAEIAKWTNPKSISSSVEPISVFPSGLHFSSPNLKSILGLRSKREVRIKQVDILHSSVLTIMNYVSEETCADLLKNQKTVYRSLLSDCSKGDRENVNVYHQMASSNNPILRRMLGNRILADHHPGVTLPDITNLNVTLDCSSDCMSRLHQITSMSKLIQKDESIIRKSPRKANGTNSNSSHMDDLKSIKIDGVCKDNKLLNSSIHLFKCGVKVKELEEVEMVSCETFIDPKPSDLPRGEIPSQTLSPKLSDESCSTSSDDSITTHKANSKLNNAKRSGIRSIIVNSPPSAIEDILSLEDNPLLFQSFVEHFRQLRHQPNGSGDGSPSVGNKQSNNASVTENSTCISPVKEFSKCSYSVKRDLKCKSRMKKKSIRSSEVQKQSKSNRFPVEENSKCSSLVKKDLKCSYPAKKQINSSPVNKDFKISSPVKETTNCASSNKRMNESVSDYVESGTVKDARRQLNDRGDMKGKDWSEWARQEIIRKGRRKSSSRVVTKVKVGLKRRLSAAGLVKREEPLGMIPTDEMSPSVS